MNVVIFRPSIIAASSQEPFEGWTDSTSAAGGISIMICLGVITVIDESGNSKADIIPVDIVSNGIIITTAHSAQVSEPDKGSLFIYNCGTSQNNVLSWNQYTDGVVDACKYLEFNRKIRNVDFKFEAKENKINIR